MNEYLSRKFKVLSLLLMVMVVYIHFNPGLTLNLWHVKSSLGEVNTTVSLFVQHGFTRVAVPLFFLISGYLFFLNIKQGLWQEFRKKYVSRTHSLLVPYLFWFLFWLLFIILFRCLRATDALFQGRYLTFGSAIQHYGLARYLQPRHLWFTLWAPQPNYPLWYIRDLMGLVVLTPVIYWITRRFKLIPFLLSLIPYFLDLRIRTEGFTGTWNLALTFFLLGSYLAIWRKDILQMQWTDRGNCATIGLLWIALLSAQTICVLNSCPDWLTTIVHRSGVLVGLCFTWNAYDIMARHGSWHWIDRLLPYSFIIYVCHAPIKSYLVNRISNPIVGRDPGWNIVGYFIFPILDIAICILLGWVVRRTAPRIYSLATGGRTPR